MKIYWYIKSIPEYKDADNALIKKTWMPSYWKTYRCWQQWVMALISISSFVYLLAHPREPIWPFQIIGITLVCVIWITWSQVSIALTRRYLRELLNDEHNT